MGSTATTADPCIFHKRGNSDTIIIVAIYVDDTLVASVSEKQVADCKTDISAHFETKDIGPLRHVLGMRFDTNANGDVVMHQEAYIKETLDRFGFANCNSVSTRAVTGEARSNEEQHCDFPYRQAVGCLMYAATSTRPDIAYAVHWASHSLVAPTNDDVIAVKRIFRYLAGTASLGSVLRKALPRILQGYADSDFAADTSDRKSRTGYVFVRQRPIAWRSQKRSVVTLSSTEAEYVALSSAVQEATYLRRLLVQLELIEETPTTTFDGQPKLHRTVQIRHHVRSHSAHRRQALLHQPSAA